MLKAKVEGMFKPNREKDDLMCTLGTPEHTRRMRGLGEFPGNMASPHISRLIEAHAKARLNKRRKCV